MGTFRLCFTALLSFAVVRSTARLERIRGAPSQGGGPRCDIRAFVSLSVVQVYLVAVLAANRYLLLETGAHPRSAVS